MTNTFYPFSPGTIEGEALKKLNNEEKNTILQNTNVYEDANDINIYLKKEITGETIDSRKNMILGDFLLEPECVLSSSIQLAIFRLDKVDKDLLHLLIKASTEEEKKIFEKNMHSNRLKDAQDFIDNTGPIRFSEINEANKKFYNILKEIIAEKKEDYKIMIAEKKEYYETMIAEEKIRAEKRDIINLIKTKTTILSFHEKEKPRGVLYGDGFKISDIPYKYKNDEGFLLEIIKINCDVLSIIPETFTTNINFMYKAIRINPRSYEYASEELKKVFGNDPKMIKYLKDHEIVSDIAGEDIEDVNVIGENVKVSNTINVTSNKKGKILEMINNIFSKK